MDAGVSVLGSVLSDVTAVFSDIDGTLAHYGKTLVTLGYERCLEGSAVDIDAEESGDEVDLLLRSCYPQTYRNQRFGAAAHQFWQHKETGKVLKMYELYNLSLTGAVISERTILLMELLQSEALLYKNLAPPNSDALHSARVRRPVVCCLITGARTSTLLRRRQGGTLPQTAFESCEGGGKLWCRLRHPEQWFKVHATGAGSTREGTVDDSCFVPHTSEIAMDADWTNRFENVTGYRVGSPGDEKAALQETRRTMWALESELNAAGFVTDHQSYDTSFLIDIKKSPCLRANAATDGRSASSYPAFFNDADEAERFIVARFQEVYNKEFGVELFVNLGKGQINARGSGKRGVMLHVLQKANEIDRRVNHTPEDANTFCVENTVALFDDENDLQFAELCGAGMLPSVAHAEVLLHGQWTCEPSKRKWFRPPVDGPLGSEWALKQIVLFKRHRAASS
ncbi:hypothetical protein NESM_000898700 [Novymonas esmeraldas]|uniref:Uncharacterized protein n=1 Tax=Novymonas esmeraldas TaxID=1808958 RepID=A0AAW0EY72_9TRYP